MTGALVLLAALAVAALILWLTHRGGDDEAIAADEPAPAQGAHGAFCCGRHAVCEKGLRPAEPVYFDDEELDRYAGCPADGYSDADIDLFREIMLSMKATEVAEWCESLEMRGIAFPLPLRDELILILSETPRNDGDT